MILGLYLIQKKINRRRKKWSHHLILLCFTLLSLSLSGTQDGNHYGCVFTNITKYSWSHFISSSHMDSRYCWCRSSIPSCFSLLCLCKSYHIWFWQVILSPVCCGVTILLCLVISIVNSLFRHF